MERKDIIHEAFKKNGGILRTLELNNFGLLSRQIKKLLEVGVDIIPIEGADIKYLIVTVPYVMFLGMKTNEREVFSKAIQRYAKDPKVNIRRLLKSNYKDNLILKGGFLLYSISKFITKPTIERNTFNGLLLNQFLIKIVGSKN